MRWVVATDDFPPQLGGVATWTEAVAGGLHEAGVEVLVLARRRPELGLESPYRVHGVFGPSFGRWGPRWMGLALWRHLTRDDVLLATTWPMAAHGMDRAHALGIPVHLVFHGSDLTRPAEEAASFQQVAAEARHRWAVSDYLRGLVEARDFSGHTLPAPIDVQEARGPSAANEHWGMIARATGLKGCDRFVRLVAAAGVRGTLVGDGEELDTVRALAAELGANMSFTGALSREATSVVLRSFDLCLLLPRAERDGTGAEGLGLTLLEAAAVGVPGVGCKTGGVPEAVGPGLVLDEPDQIEASIQAIREWWKPGRGGQSRDWLAATHGIQRCVDCLLG